MSTICEICGKEFKNTQGLRGHKAFVHNQTTKKSTGAAAAQLVSKPEFTANDTQPSTDQHSNKLEERLQQLEQVSAELFDLVNNNSTSVTDITRQLDEQAQQHRELAQQVHKFDEDLKSAETVSRERWARFTQQVESLGEADNRLTAVVNSNTEKITKVIDASNGKFATIERNFVEIKRRFDNIEAQIVKDRDGFKLIEQRMNRVEADIGNIKLRMLREPTGDVVSLSMTDGRKHSFKQYRSPQGLRRPSKTSTDWALGDRYVDLSEPED